MADQTTRTREHLANERTFLAWTRTGIALLGVGFLVAKLRLELVPGAAGGLNDQVTLGALFAVSGLATVVFALARYTSTRKAIERGDFSPLGWGAIVLVIVVVLVGLVILLDLVGLVGLR